MSMAHFEQQEAKILEWPLKARMPQAATATVDSGLIMDVPGAADHNAPIRVNYPERKRGLISPSNVTTGYLPSNPVLDEVINRGLAAALLALVSPIFIAVWLALRLSSRDPIFYMGDRIGKDGGTFQILKFRTLRMGSQAKLANGTLPKRTQMETSLGAYLRKCRIDELPQLINVVRGEMAMFGPRPIRPEMIPVYRAESPGFETRFRVKPGLVGYSQALFPHSASKRLRGRFNAMGCAAPIRYRYVLRFVAIVGFSVLRRTVATLFEALRNIGSPLASHAFLRSGFATPRAATIALDDGAQAQTGALVSLSDEILQFVTTLPVEAGEMEVQISRRRRNGRTVTITLQANIQAVTPMGLGRSGFAGYATLAPLSGYTRYRLERYFMDQSVVPS